MRFSENLSLLLAAAGSQVVAQSFYSTTETASVTSDISSTSAAATSTDTSTPETPHTGELGDATVVTNNPVGVVYKATLPKEAYFKGAYIDGGNIEGEITAQANSDGKGVTFNLKLSNLPKTDTTLTYHLHVAPVPEDGNCTETLAHLDPFIRGETSACDADAPETCQVGDLSGKHGKIPTAPGTFETSYTDLYASTVEGIGAFFGNRSIVIHFLNKTRITCANFEKVEGGDSGSAGPTQLPTGTGGSGGGSPTGGNPGAPTTSGPVLGGATSTRAGIAGAVVFAAAALCLL